MLQIKTIVMKKIMTDKYPIPLVYLGRNRFVVRESIHKTQSNIVRLPHKSTALKDLLTTFSMRFLPLNATDAILCKVNT